MLYLLRSIIAPRADPGAPPSRLSAWHHETFNYFYVYSVVAASMSLKVRHNDTVRSTGVRMQVWASKGEM